MRPRTHRTRFILFNPGLIASDAFRICVRRSSIGTKAVSEAYAGASGE